MESEFDRGRLLNELNRLPFMPVLAYALSCAERLYPNYLKFSRVHGWGDPSALREALDHGWDRLVGRGLGNDVEPLRRRCEMAAPDTEDFASPFVSPGLDAACAALMVLDYLSTERADVVADIASLCRDTVDMYVQEIDAIEPDDPERERKVLCHPLMQRELQRQRQDLTRVARLTNDTEQASIVRDEWRDPSRSNIDVSATG